MLTKVKALLQLGIHTDKEVEDRKKFFARVALTFSSYDPRYRLIEKAYNDAKDAFRDVVRDGGGRYFEHLRGVTLIVMDYLRITDHEIIIASLLHDIVEDKPEWTIDRIAREYGPRVAMLVDYLSKPQLELYGGDRNKRDTAYHERFRSAPREFFYIKLSDRLHNLLTLWESTKEKRIRKIKETELYYLHYAEEHCILIHELEAAMDELKQEA